MKKYLTVFMIIACLCLFACSKADKSETPAEKSEAPAEKAEVAQGVQFEKLNLPDAFAKAKTENKLVMIDVFSPT